MLFPRRLPNCSWAHPEAIRCVQGGVAVDSWAYANLYSHHSWEDAFPYHSDWCLPSLLWTKEHNTIYCTIFFFLKHFLVIYFFKLRVSCRSKHSVMCPLSRFTHLSLTFYPTCFICFLPPTPLPPYSVQVTFFSEPRENKSQTYGSVALNTPMLYFLRIEISTYITDFW